VQKFERTLIQVVTLLVQSPFLYRADVGMMRNHNVFQIERDDLTGKTGELYVEVDAESRERYDISSRVTSLSKLISAVYSGFM
jgi:hypothetical protein